MPSLSRVTAWIARTTWRSRVALDVLPLRGLLERVDRDPGKLDAPPRGLAGREHVAAGVGVRRDEQRHDRLADELSRVDLRHHSTSPSSRRTPPWPSLLHVTRGVGHVTDRDVRVALGLGLGVGGQVLEPQEDPRPRGDDLLPLDDHVRVRVVEDAANVERFPVRRHVTDVGTQLGQGGSVRRREQRREVHWSYPVALMPMPLSRTLPVVSPAVLATASAAVPA